MTPSHEQGSELDSGWGHGREFEGSEESLKANKAVESGLV